MADFPVDLHIEALTADLSERLARAIDPDGKIPRALEALGPIAARDVLLVDGGAVRARQLAELGARLTIVPPAADPTPNGSAFQAIDPPPILASGRAGAFDLPAESTDAMVACWSAFRGPSADEVAEADRVLRPGGRLLVVHDYGRDDVSQLWPEADARYHAWSRRDGWFLQSGFKIRVVHCWWAFESIEDARDLLASAFGDAGASVASRLRRPRLSYNVAVYHRTRSGGAVEDPAAGRESGEGEQPADVDDLARLAPAAARVAGGT